MSRCDIEIRLPPAYNPSLSYTSHTLWEIPFSVNILFTPFMLFTCVDFPEIRSYMFLAKHSGSRMQVHGFKTARLSNLLLTQSHDNDQTTMTFIFFALVRFKLVRKENLSVLLVFYQSEKLFRLSLGEGFQQKSLFWWFFLDTIEYLEVVSLYNLNWTKQGCFKIIMGRLPPVTRCS